MSHNKERAEKACLNCGTMPLYDRYCQHCGQENVEPKQTLWHLVTHFFSDVTHFDGKFFSTMKMLLLKPGFLSAEYVHGRRTKYLDPIRMYLFISALFFIVMYSLFEMEGIKSGDFKAIKFMDSLRTNIKPMEEGLRFELIDKPGYNTMSVFDIKESLKHGHTYYDSVQNSKALNTELKDNWLERYFNHHLMDIYKTYKDNPYNFIPNSINLFFHSFSKIFFISLPLFAFYLYVLFIRRRKQWYYVSHAIFTLHYYSVGFIFLFIIILAYKAPWMTIEVFNVISYIVAAGLLLYLYLAMLQYYRQNWFKTLIKFVILAAANFVSFIVLLVLMLLHALGAAH